MTQLAVRQHDWQRALQSYPASPNGAATLAKVLHHVDRVLLAVTRQHWSIPRAVAGLPVVRIKSTGVHSGYTRVVPVIGIQDGTNIIVLAANWGLAKNPAWLFNLRADPLAELDFYGTHGVYVANEVIAKDEYLRLWRKAVSIYPGFESYRDRLEARAIPIVVFSPCDEPLKERA